MQISVCLYFTLLFLQFLINAKGTEDVKRIVRNRELRGLLKISMQESR